MHKTVYCACAPSASPQIPIKNPKPSTSDQSQAIKVVALEAALPQVPVAINADKRRNNLCKEHDRKPSQQTG